MKVQLAFPICEFCIQGCNQTQMINTYTYIYIYIYFSNYRSFQKAKFEFVMSQELYT